MAPYTVCAVTRSIGNIIDFFPARPPTGDPPKLDLEKRISNLIASTVIETVTVLEVPPWSSTARKLTWYTPSWVVFGVKLKLPDVLPVPVTWPPMPKVALEGKLTALKVIKSPSASVAETTNETFPPCEIVYELGTTEATTGCL